MSVAALGVVDGAVMLVAMLAGSFELKGCMGNAVLGKFLSDGVLDVVGVTVCNYVQGGIVVVAIHAPDVNVVNILYAFEVRKMLAKLLNFDSVGRFFEEQINGFFQIFGGIDENKDCDTNRHQGVDDSKISKSHYNGTDQNNEPAEDVLEHVQINRLLVERVPFPCKEGGEEVHSRAHNGKNDHSVIIDGRGVDDTQNSIVNNQNRADQKNECGNNTADNRVARVSVGVVLVGLLFALLFEEIRNSNACGVSNIVHGIRNDGNAARKKAAKKFKNGKGEIEDKCNQNISFGFHKFLLGKDDIIIAYSAVNCNRIFSNSFKIEKKGGPF